MEARTGIEPVYTALQAAASPLCHLATADDAAPVASLRQIYHRQGSQVVANPVSW